jgi:hypothetical protein
VISLPGWDITYTITVTNLDPSDVENLFISGAIPVQALDPTWTCCACDDGEYDILCEPPTCREEPRPWPDIVFFARADLPAGEWAIYAVNGTLDWWPCGPFTNTVTFDPAREPDASARGHRCVGREQHRHRGQRPLLPLRSSGAQVFPWA